MSKQGLARLGRSILPVWGALFCLVSVGAQAKVTRPPLPAAMTVRTQTLHGDWIAFHLAASGFVDQAVRLTILPAAGAKKRKTAIRISGETVFGTDTAAFVGSVPVEVTLDCGEAGHACFMVAGQQIHIVVDSPDQGVLFVDGKRALEETDGGQWLLRRRGVLPDALGGDWFASVAGQGQERARIDVKKSTVQLLPVDPDGGDEGRVLNLLWMRGSPQLLMMVPLRAEEEQERPQVSEVRRVTQGVLLTDIDQRGRTLWSRDTESRWFVGSLHVAAKPAKRSPRGCRSQQDGNGALASNIQRALIDGRVTSEETLAERLKGAKRGPLRNARMTSTSPAKVRVWSERGPAAGDTWIVTKAEVHHAVTVCPGGER